MTPHTSTLADIDHYERAAILAGLRLLQATPALPAGIEGIATDEGDFARLGTDRIDELYERINTISEDPWRDVTGDDAATIALDARVAALVELTEEKVSRLRSPGGGDVPAGFRHGGGAGDPYGPSLCRRGARLCPDEGQSDLLNRGG